MKKPSHDFETVFLCPEISKHITDIYGLAIVLINFLPQITSSVRYRSGRRFKI
jgi:hypothetical protein